MTFGLWSVIPILKMVLPTPLARAAPVGPEETHVLLDDPAVVAAVTDAVAARPELRQARSRMEAEAARGPQASTLPDPTVAFGIQNDGFTGIQVGKMETSWWSIGAAQTFPWFGKRELRAGVAEVQVRKANAELARALLGARAEVERAYLDLLAIREQKNLLTRLEGLWAQSEAAARARYESGEGAQSDLLRAQLARNRLRQRRLAVDADEQRRLLIMNRLRGRPATEPVPTPFRLLDVADPALPEVPQAIAGAAAHSPELQLAALQEEQAERQLGVVQKDAYPDLTVSAAVMPRGGPFVTMWQAGVSLNLPVWSAMKRRHAVTENRAWKRSAVAAQDAVRALLEQRVRERHVLLTAAVENNRLYRSGLLVQSEATVTSTLAQYRVGKVPLASVLEAMSGYVGDVDGFLQSIVEAQRLMIAEREINLADTGGAAAALLPTGGMTDGSVRASGGSGMGARGPEGSSPSSTSASAMSKM